MIFTSQPDDIMVAREKEINAFLDSYNVGARIFMRYDSKAKFPYTVIIHIKRERLSTIMSTHPTFRALSSYLKGWANALTWCYRVRPDLCRRCLDQTANAKVDCVTHILGTTEKYISENPEFSLVEKDVTRAQAYDSIRTIFKFKKA